MLALLSTACALGGACSSSPSTSGKTEGGMTAKTMPTCSQLKAADVQGLMTNPVVGGAVVTTVGYDADGQQCVFGDADSTQAVDVIVVPANDPVAGYAASMQGTTNPVAVPGVGDAAFRPTGDIVPFAEHGGVLCTVSIADATQVPGVAALVVNGTLDLTEGQDAIIAAALGTVCNRIFGSGNVTPELSGL